MPTANFDWSQITQWIFPIAILVIFVVMIIVPQRKRDNQMRQMLDGIKKGDKIKTIGGIYGKVVLVEGDKVVIESSQTKMQFAKGAIATVESAEVEGDMDTGILEKKKR